MRILVTGAAGFAGHHIADYLGGCGHDVLAGYRNTPLRPWLRATPFHTDTRDPPAVLRSLDAIIHTAGTAPGLPNISARNVIEDNVPGVRWALTTAALSGAKVFINFSSVSVYGSIREHELTEATPIRAPTPYGRSKLEGERLVHDWADAHPNRACLNLRLPGILGPGARRCWLTLVATQLRAGAEVLLHSPDAPFNNAVHIDDLARFCAEYIESPRPLSDTVVLAATGTVTVRSAVEHLAQAMGTPPVIRVAPGQHHHFSISPFRARQRHGWKSMDIAAVLDRYGHSCVKQTQSLEVVS